METGLRHGPMAQYGRTLSSVPATLARRVPMVRINLSTEPDYRSPAWNTPLPRLESKMRQRNSSASRSDNRPLLPPDALSFRIETWFGSTRASGVSKLRRPPPPLIEQGDSNRRSRVRPRVLCRFVISRRSFENPFHTSVAQSTWQRGAVILVPASNVGCVRRVPAI